MLNSSNYKGLQKHWHLFALFALLLPFAGVRSAENVDLDAEMAKARRKIEAVADKVIQGYLAEQGPKKDQMTALLLVGTMYETGDLGERDQVRAAEYYRQAAELGSPQAHCSLGIIYDRGAESPTGRIERDPVAAREHFEKAAAGKVLRAIVELGMIYSEGRNVDPDSKKALEYFTDAASRGDATALERLDPIMRKAKEWEEAKPGRKANFPTSREELIKTELVQQQIDINFELERRYSRVFVEINRRIAAALKGK